MKKPIRFDPRERPRCPLRASAVLSAGDRRVEVSIFDLSGEGFGATGLPEARQGALISLMLPEIGLIPARIVWTRSDRFGAHFLRPIDLRNCPWTEQAEGRPPVDRRASAAPRPFSARSA
jgi:hypothetical protein